MAVVVGYQGLVTSWASNTQLISTGFKPMRYTMTQTADSFDATIMGASLTTGLNGKGLRSWSVVMEGHRPTAAIGSAASVTFSVGYATNVRSWEITFTAAAIDTTIMGASDTTNGWRQFTPGIISVEGSYDVFLDSSTPLAAPSNASEPGTITLELGGTKNFAFSALTQGGPVDVALGQAQTARYAFRNAGAVTVTDAGDTLPLAAGSLAIPTAGSLVLTSATNQTFTGSAFWRRIRMVCPVDGPILTTVEAQGSGAITYG